MVTYVSIIIHLEVINFNVQNFNFPIGHISGVVLVNMLASEWGTTWIRPSVRSKQRKYNWYLLLLW